MPTSQDSGPRQEDEGSKSARARLNVPVTISRAAGRKLQALVRLTGRDASELADSLILQYAGNCEGYHPMESEATRQILAALTHDLRQLEQPLRALAVAIDSTANYPKSEPPAWAISTRGPETGTRSLDLHVVETSSGSPAQYMTFSQKIQQRYKMTPMQVFDVLLAFAATHFSETAEAKCADLRAALEFALADRRRERARIHAALHHVEHVTILTQALAMCYQRRAILNQRGNPK